MIRFRVKQISKNEFIPQVQEGFGNWILNRWANIVIYKYVSPHAYYFDNEYSRSIENDIEKALDNIELYKVHLIEQNKEIQEEKKYPIIHKL